MPEDGRSTERQDEGLFAGRVRLRQPTRGHRSGTDAILLAAAAPLDRVGTAVDFGAGVGAVGLLLASRSPSLQVVLVERDPETAALARLNVAANGWEGRVTVEQRDVTAQWPSPPRAGLVVANPPYLVEGQGRITTERQEAHVMPEGGLDAWVKAALACLAPRGRLVLIHRADALGVVLAALERRFGGIAVRPVQAREGEAAIRILVRGTKGSRAPLRLLPPLVLHGADGAFTPAASALHRGEADLAWD